MNESYGRDLDLNLLRVFVIVAEEGSVTAAASRLYLTQPAVSAALRRLATAVGAPLVTRAGRGVALTGRGRSLLAAARPHLDALVTAALSPPSFDPLTSELVVRLGLSDANEAWLLPALLDVLASEAPRMRVIVLPAQFRTVGDLLADGRIDLAVTVADALPSDVLRRALFTGRFVGLYDGKRLRLPARLDRKRYLACEHAIVSYNGDLRGVVEDQFGLQRNVRISLPSFQSLVSALPGTSLLATVPAMVAAHAMQLVPSLRSTALPFEAGGEPVEMLWRRTVDDDPAHRFVRERVVEIAETSKRPRSVAHRR